jgi:hypothetical protein
MGNLGNTKKVWGFALCATAPQAGFKGMGAYGASSKLIAES